MKIKTFAFVSLIVFSGNLNAHFQMLIPSDDMVQARESRTLNLDLRFWHPMEGHGMEMAAPNRFGVWANGKHTDLTSSLNAVKSKDRRGQQWQRFDAAYAMKKPGDHIFYVEPKPYWEPEEESFIVHYTKVVVNGFGLEKGWDQPLGLKSEIIPLTRPYGLWAGNIFQGQVLLDGKPVPFSEVEVEFYDQQGHVKIPADPMITQVIKADKNGVFTYAMPWQGWWGFAALNEGDQKMEHDGKPYAVEIGAVIWVKTYKVNQ